MEPYFVEIRDSETQSNFIVDMEGPYHAEDKRIGEHIYGITLLIDGSPYHFEKYIPTKEELTKFQEENEGEPQLSEGKFLYRLVPFTK
ncbi:MAG: hypothetical protein Q8N12_05345 [Thermodesulfovibrionales bacterium]|nr:hypothetical protein [Thermodesulfovibrionales bacterium]